VHQAFVLTLKEPALEDYVRHHDSIQNDYPDLMEALIGSGANSVDSSALTRGKWSWCRGDSRGARTISESRNTSAVGILTLKKESCDTWKATSSISGASSAKTCPVPCKCCWMPRRRSQRSTRSFAAYARVTVFTALMSSITG